MPIHYAKRVAELLLNEGPTELFKRMKTKFLRGLYNIIKNSPVESIIFKTKTYINYTMNRIKYDAPKNPYDIIYVSPKNVNYRIYYKNNDLIYEEFGGLGQVKDGDWDTDRCRDRIEDLWKIHGLRERFEEGLPWKETIYYNYLNENISDTPETFDSKEEYISTRIHFYEELYNRIENKGYISDHSGQNHCGNIGITQKLEVLVTIDRNGGIHLWNGHHRFAVALILDLEIPVQVVCRHKRWQELRDDIYNNAFSEEYDELSESHPDLQDIINY